MYKASCTLYYRDQQMHSIYIHICIYIYIYINKILYIEAFMNISMHLHHLQGVLSFYFANVTKIIRVTNTVLQQLTAYNVLQFLYCHQL